MAINFSDAQGNIFPQLGKLGLLAANLYSYQQTLLASMTDTTYGVVAQFNAQSDIQALMGSSYVSHLASPETVTSTAQAMAIAAINRVVFLDNPQINQTLLSGDITISVLEMIRQMYLAGASVLTVNVTATPTSNPAFVSINPLASAGNGVINASVRRALDGRVMENSFSETVQVRCSDDSYTGSAVLGNEGFILTGDGNQSDWFAFNWPLGSNGQININAIDGDTSNGSGNLLTNSGFGDFTNNAPDNFTLVVGAAGTNYFQQTSIVFGSSGSSLQITGDGSGTLCDFRQQFNSSSGTVAALTPLTQYSFAIWMRGGASAPASGVMVFDLIDGNDNPILDEASNANSFSVNLTGLNSMFAPFTGTFRTPEIMPSTYYLRARLTTALPNGTSIYLDKMGMGLMNQLYTSGPSFAVHSGSTPFSIGDYGTVTVTNGRGSGGTLATFQTLICRLIPQVFYDQGIMLPSSSNPSISDGLIAFN